ncbi:hypothetical protein Ciccas_002663 [Cichlidogyrus casuarinus]|uniref:Uncharacterized protein n=1 Tax=Cichlidogyrus casuarinus TaxID=1844966 RepID=A0ABD2QIW4_9PLAT
MAQVLKFPAKRKRLVALKEPLDDVLKHSSMCDGPVSSDSESSGGIRKPILKRKDSINIKDEDVPANLSLLAKVAKLPDIKADQDAPRRISVQDEIRLSHIIRCLCRGNITLPWKLATMGSLNANDLDELLNDFHNKNKIQEAYCRRPSLIADTIATRSRKVSITGFQLPIEQASLVKNSIFKKRKASIIAPDFSKSRRDTIF